jgi:hypothetical protein
VSPRVVNQLHGLEFGENLRNDWTRGNNEFRELFVCQPDIDEMPMSAWPSRETDKIVQGDRCSTSERGYKLPLHATIQRRVLRREGVQEKRLESAVGFDVLLDCVPFDFQSSHRAAGNGVFACEKKAWPKWQISKDGSLAKKHSSQKLA